MSKRIITIFIFVCVIGLATAAYASPPSYYLDSIYDNQNTGNWLDTTPTLKAGQTYDITISGHGSKADGSSPTKWAHAALYIDWSGSIQDQFDWHNEFLDHIQLYGNDYYTGNKSERYYSIAGSVTVPDSVTDGDTLAFAALKPGKHWNDGNQWASIYYWTTGNDGILGDKEFSWVHLESKGNPPPIPEPSSIFLLSCGLLGFVARRTFRKKSR